MLIDRVLLIDVYLEELVVALAPVVLVPSRMLLSQVATASARGDIRVDLLEISLNQIVLGDLEEATLSAVNWDEVSLGFKRAEVDLSNKLHRKGWSGGRHVDISLR
jgi:hypothetical protein